MSRIRSKNTVPEMVVRSLLHKAGFRFRLHVDSLPGKPDIVLPKWHTVVFVNGCFWHRHKRCKFAYEPKSRIEFWKSKFESNVARDKQKTKALQRLGWVPIVIWECETKNSQTLARKLKSMILNQP